MIISMLYRLNVHYIHIFTVCVIFQTYMIYIYILDIVYIILYCIVVYDIISYYIILYFFLKYIHIYYSPILEVGSHQECSPLTFAT